MVWCCRPDAAYSTLTQTLAQSTMLAITDNDVASVVTNVSSVILTETHDTQVYNIRLTSEPARATPPTSYLHYASFLVLECF